MLQYHHGLDHFKLHHHHIENEVFEKFSKDSLLCTGFPENLSFAEFRHRYEILASANFRPSGPVVDEKQVGLLAILFSCGWLFCY